MRYIKKFNEVDKDDFYTKISLSSYDKLLNDKIPISKQSIYYIKGFFNKGWIVNIYFDKRENKYLIVNNEDIKIIIYELPDEYFLIDIIIINNNKPAIKSLAIYKCDQLDGVKELLKDLKLI